MQMFRDWRRWWLALVGSVVLLEEGLSAVSRGARGKSDLSVFYRTAILLAHGADGTLYAGRDIASGWYRCIPPAGMMWFAPLASLSAREASTIWVLFNFALVGLGALALRAILNALDREGQTNAHAALPFVVGLLFLMAAPSVEVGQYSLMFVVLWLLALWFAVGRKFEGMAIMLALPASIKIYPLLLLLAPLGASRFKRWPRFLVAFALGCAFWTWGVPSLFYGGRTVQLESAFWRDVVMSPTGRLSESQNLRSYSNHGLDAVLLRFGSSESEPVGAPPHLNFAPGVVLALANPLRVLLIALSLVMWWQRQRTQQRESEETVRQWVDSFALWSATLFLLLPGAKARYAVYAFIGFLPLVFYCVSLFQAKSPHRWIYSGFIAGLVMLVTSLVPIEARLWEAGFWGALLVWLENGRLLVCSKDRKQAKSPNSRQQREGVAKLRAL